jgi:uncharacterized protein involved in exopolysaccharide biosynthesis
MEEEIDLREYIEVLIRHWKLILALAVIAGLTAAAVSFLILEPTYQATALVLITNPRYQLRFDPRLETLSDVETASKAFPALATSDDLVRLVVETLNEQEPEQDWTFKMLKGKLAASAASDPSLLRLTSTNGDAEGAARIANVWAAEYVDYVNELYGRREQDVGFFTQQLAVARADLEAAEEALVEFQSRNQSSILGARLSSARQAQGDYLSDQRAIAYIQQDIQGLRDQLADQPSERTASLADDLTALFLQVKAFNAGASVPVQLQVTSAESLSNKTVQEQIEFLEDLGQSLETKSTEIDARLEELEPEILRLQEALQEVNTQQNRLNRDRTVAEDTYITLANKVEEARIAAQDETGEVRLASEAAVPTSPAGPRRLMNTAIAGFLGLFLGVFVAFFVDYWRAPRATPETEA